MICYDCEDQEIASRVFETYNEDSAWRKAEILVKEFQDKRIIKITLIEIPEERY